MIQEVPDTVKTTAPNNATQSSLSISGQRIARYEYDYSGSAVVYQWQEQGTSFEVMARLAGQLTEQDLEHMIASMLTEGGESTTPVSQASPTAPARLTFDQLQQKAHYYLAQPTWLPSYLVPGGVMIGETTPPGTTPTSQEIHVSVLSYLPTDPGQPYSLAIRELDSTITPEAPTGSITTITIDGQVITRSAATQLAPGEANIVNFQWSEKGTHFWVAAQMAGPLTEQDIEHMIASMLGQATGQATPVSSGGSAQAGTGSDNNLTVAQAQQVVGFKIIEPTNPSGSLFHSPYRVSAYHIGNSGADKANYVEMYYPENSVSSLQSLVLVETTNKRAVPAVNGNTASLVPPTDATLTMTIVPGTESKLNIQGIVVTRFDVADSDSRTSYFVWTNHGVSSYIEMARSGAGTAATVGDADLQQMIGGMIKERRGLAWWSSSVISDMLALLRGLVLAFVLVAVYRLRHIMLWARPIFVVVALVIAVLVVDDIVRGPWIAVVGFVVGGALVLGSVPLYDRWRHARRRAAV